MAERHAVAPRGAYGGGDGRCGSHAFIGRDGTARDLPAKAVVSLEPGDTIVIHTAGGGGYGSVSERDVEAIVRDGDDGITMTS